MRILDEVGFELYNLCLLLEIHKSVPRSCEVLISRFSQALQH